jgi:HAD superfamily hydrolase (TIGR01509 family)
MDGVLVDGEPLHFAAVNELLADEGRALTFEAYQPYMGTKAGWAELILELGLANPETYYRPRYDTLILRQYRELAEPVDGATCLVLDLARRGIPVALASSSVRPWVEACLERIGLAGAFDSVTTGDEVDAGKPDPEIYLLAAERLGLEPEDCLAVEDAPAGVASAAAAGMTCWAVRTEYTRGLELPGAERVFDSLRDIDVREIVGAAA